MSLIKEKKILKKYKEKCPLVCLTSYTYPLAKLTDKYADILLVGDSVGPVLYGLQSTKYVSLDVIIQHAKAVSRATKNAMLVVDMPFGTYEKNINIAYKNAEKIINETGADAVKIEGGQKIANTVEFLVRKGITVFGHIGMLPQSFNGKYKVYGKSDSQKKQIIKDLKCLEGSGVFSIVIECTIEKLAKKVCDISNVPIIGIGASKSCDGQILVTEDLLGLTDFNSKFLKKYVNLQHIIDRSLNNFSKDVKEKSFPSRKNFYK